MRQLRHPKPEEITLTGVLAALSDPVRLSIVSTLARTQGERAWGDFDVGVGASTLSHHMKTLRLAGVIVHRKDGTRCFVSLRPDLDRIFPGLLRSILAVADRPAAIQPEESGAEQCQQADAVPSTSVPQEGHGRGSRR